MVDVSSRRNGLAVTVVGGILAFIGLVLIPVGLFFATPESANVWAIGMAFLFVGIVIGLAGACMLIQSKKRASEVLEKRSAEVAPASPPPSYGVNPAGDLAL